MRLQGKPWLGIALLAAATLICCFAIDRFQHRFVRSDRDLIGLLPGQEATVFYGQIDLLRRAGLLNLFAGSKDAEYQSFVSATGFDYTKNVDAIAVAAKQGEAFAAMKGQFAWSRMRSYIRDRGGSCADDLCQFRSSKRDTWISLVRVQGNVIALSVGAKELWRKIHPGQQRSADMPTDPVWVKLAPELLKDPAKWPVPFGIFVEPLQSAESVVFYLDAAPANSGNAFEIKLHGSYSTTAAANGARSLLEIDTKVLKFAFARQHVNPGTEVAAIMISGTFRTNGSLVTGSWPVSKDLLKALQQ